MTASTELKVYIDTTDRQASKLAVVSCGSGEVIAKKEGDFDIVSTLAATLTEHKLALDNIAQVVANPGPGSFTGIRIGVAVANALNWALGKLSSKDALQPMYGAEPNITPPKKFKV